jgi:hypothetical protein
MSKKTDIPIPRTMTFAPVNFETETLEEGLLNDLYFRGRTDELKIGSLAHIINAIV